MPTAISPTNEDIDLKQYSLTAYGETLAQSLHFPEVRPTLKKASFGAGCFWGVEDLYRGQEGVVATLVGYMGGTLKNPTYKQVCSNTTGHAEVLQVVFNPAVITYGQLLHIFWHNHDPTTPNRQGPDVGTQYRSAIFFHSKVQRQAAQVSKEQLEKEKKFRNAIVTEITPASSFYKAEEYHQRYLEKTGRSSCHVRF